MKTGPKGIALIKKKEEFRARKYLCAAGKPTIGYGHVIQANEARLMVATLTEPEASAMLARDLVQYEQCVVKHIHRSLTESQYDALVTLCYNIGVGGFAGSSVVKHINAGSPAASVRLSWEAWNKITDPRTGLKLVAKGLVQRRQEELQLFYH